MLSFGASRMGDRERHDGPPPPWIYERTVLGAALHCVSILLKGQWSLARGISPVWECMATFLGSRISSHPSSNAAEPHR